VSSRSRTLFFARRQGMCRGRLAEDRDENRDKLAKSLHMMLGARIMLPTIHKITTGPNMKVHNVAVSALPAIKVSASTEGVINLADLQHASCCCSGIISEAELDSTLLHQA
jgi:hypothetical protein